MRWFPVLLALTRVASADADFWDLEPIRYSDTAPTDRLAKLAADLSSGAKKVDGQTGLERLRFVLKELAVPEESQVLVFSKTSLQIAQIHPKNPRALFFSDEAYVGYVPGGSIEVIIQDPVLGPVFYVVEPGGPGGLDIERDTSLCMSCHGTTRTEGVPGMTVRSVFPNGEGHPMLAMGTTQVSHETPLPERWGGYYVTGRSSLPHLGNRTFVEGGDDQPQPSDLDQLGGLIEVAKYPRATSDIVALMVLEHQCRMHNLLNAAALQYRRARYISSAIDPNADPDQGSAGRVADGMAQRIVECLFFKDEAEPGDDLVGGEEFQKTFTARYPKTVSGESLAEFHLYDRIFKNRCSYMVYSRAFTELPVRVKQAVFARMKATLAGEDASFDYLKESERKRVAAILRETLPAWSK
ncbi:hypothetical protein OJ996_24020 [Luteolibacter sp. GHJ8]|uniref:Cytochrome c domain-containing protein n=1 Tax=Luteolibacter rhizosphaerae TaxID=2989719 RepID=A0ABT3GA09_9BACT|nr:hypothetical protein [Luteolibacter rhizosphaerae]MCW1916675.1 hypothetical protein [Luteolibacter rhizosphaerae]